jgi:nicotinamidase-related amidase
MTNCKLGNLKNTMNGGRSKRATRRLQKKRSVKPKKIRGGKRSVRARAGKKTRRNKAKRARKQRGGAQYLLEGDFSLSQAWNGFLYKKLRQENNGMGDANVDNVIEFDKGTNEKTKLPGGDREKKVLYIIDMQYDFIDEEFTDNIPGDNLTVSGENFTKQRGNFAVAEGKDLVAEKGFLEWLKKNAPNFDKIYVSRDYHQKGHMSFYQGGINNNTHASIGLDAKYDAVGIGQKGGQYPVHCLQGSQGAMLHKNLVKTLTDLYTKELEELIRNKKQDHESENIYEEKMNEKYNVLFKGMNNDNESYSALGFQVDNKKTQHHANSDNTETKVNGGYMHKTMPFNEALVFNKPIINSELTEDNYTNHTRLDFKDSTSYYVCGLAGDFCVRDTAYAIGKKIQEKTQEGGNEPNNSNVKEIEKISSDFATGAISTASENVENIKKSQVYVLGDYTRYAFLPAVSDSKSYSKDKLKDVDLLSEEGDKKGINQYIFNNKTILSNDEMNNLKNSMKNEGYSIPLQYNRFITNHQDIIADYQEAGVKIILNKECGKSGDKNVYDNIDNPVA